MARQAICQRPDCEQRVPRSDTRYCSRTCSGLMRQRRELRQCGMAGCPATVEVTPADAALYARSYCPAHVRLHRWTPGKPHTRPCLQCGTPFSLASREVDAKFCQESCRVAYRRAHSQPRPTCARCGRVRPVRYDRQTIGPYCRRCRPTMTQQRRITRPCAACGQAVTRHAKAMAKPHVFCNRQCSGVWKRQGGEFTCPRCGRTQYLPPSRLRKQKHCSRDCHFGGPRRVQRPCARPRCPNTVDTYVSRVAKGHGKFCSEDCHYQWRVSQRPRVRCKWKGCRHTETVQPWLLRSRGYRQAGYCSRQHQVFALHPREVRCARCGQTKTLDRWRPEQRYCSPTCARAAPRPHQPDPDVRARNRRILELHSQGLKAPRIRELLMELKAETPWLADWAAGEPRSTEATIRQVLSRARRGLLLV